MDNSWRIVRALPLAFATMMILVGPMALQGKAIVGGEQAASGDFPFFVSIRYTEKDTGLPATCGGSLIARNLVLTAAHCVEQFVDEPEEVAVHIQGEAHAELEFGHNAGSRAIFLHDDYSGDDYDVAVIVLHNSSRVEPVRITGIPAPVGTSARVAGYGQTKPKKRGFSDQLQAITQITVSDGYADKWWDGGPPIAPLDKFNFPDDFHPELHLVVRS